MKASGFLHCALRSPDPVRIGKFYADLFECRFFIHPVLSGLGVVTVKIASPESVFRGILEFWPLDVHWDGTTASIRKIPAGPVPMQNHVAFRVDCPKEEILEMLTAKGIAARYEPRGPGLLVVGFDDPDGNFVELFPDVETMELPSEAFCNTEDLERVMAQTAAMVTKLASLNRHGEITYPLVPTELKSGDAVS
jgi:catechol 2,3-dioxygenase-like lactoylglutathione lyase family enzyme